VRRRPPAGLFALSPGDLTVSKGAAFLRSARACVQEGGLRAVLLREPQLPDGPSLAILKDLCELRTEHAGLWIGIHDRAHLAFAAGADGVHLGFRSLRACDARIVVGDGCAVGCSTHAGDRHSTWHDADYLFHGPVHDTPSKRGLALPIGYDGLAEFCFEAERPVWGLGGLDPQHARDIRRTGAAGPAVLRGVFGAADPVAACLAWNRAWSGAAEVRP